MLWLRSFTLPDIEWMNKNTIHEALGITLTEIGADFISGKMPVDARTKQPAGILHGGASVVLAESLGSIASTLIVDQEKFLCVGVEVNANHLRAVREGWVHGTVKPIHIGRKTHVWSIELKNDEGKLSCVARLTVMVTEKSSKQ